MEAVTEAFRVMRPARESRVAGGRIEGLGHGGRFGGLMS